LAVKDPRAEYERRMHRVLEHIDQHLEAALDLDQLAAVAHFSSFHFHRLFSAWMGETVGEYLRRRRLEIAAMHLVAQPGTRILPVALSVGFGSAEAFTRAFKARFGASPTVWREAQLKARPSNRNPVQRNPGQRESKHGQVDARRFLHDADATPQQRPHKESAMNAPVRVIERQPQTIAYLRHVGPYGEPVGRFWQEQYYPWAVMHGLLEVPRYGIAHDDPEITAPAQCRYDAAAEVPADFLVTGAVFKTTIPGGKYAMQRFKGTSAEISDAWRSLLRDWLPASGLQLDNRPCFEFYPADAGYDPVTGVFECDITIPVVPL
jgi:AraC family transcriptional regulator